MKRLMIGLVSVMMIACSTFEKDNERGTAKSPLSSEERIKELERNLHEKEMFWEDTSVIICPRCNSDSVAKIAYGLIDLDNSSPEFKEKVMKRGVILGGCIVGPANCHCNNCGYEWKYRNGNKK